jgi:putative hydrolase of the HAD superfamily
MKKYSTVIFDLFDTIVDFNFRHLPSVELAGLRSRTTGREVYSVFTAFYPGISFEEFYPHFIDSYHQFQEMKHAEYREYPNRLRFKLMLRNMSIPVDSKTDLAADAMVTAHMQGLASAVEFPEENERALDKVKCKGYRMAIISNFDYAPTAYSLIEKFRIGRFFEKIVISEEVGWRKPKPVIFTTAMDLMSISPEEAIFVGDNFSADICGAKGVGMDAVWLNNKNQAEEDLDPEPDYIIRSFPDIAALLPPLK